MSAPTFLDYAPLLDFSQWEAAIQNFFCDAVQGGGLFVAPPNNGAAQQAEWTPPAGKTAFFTGLQSQVFIKARPRVDLGPISQKEIEQTRVMDMWGRLWRNGWSVPLDFFVITKADYATHVAMLAKVRAIVMFMNPGAGDGAGNLSQALIATSGLNAFLATHELARVVDAGGPTFGGKMTTDQGYFLTPLKYNAVFAVQSAKWPGGFLNN